MSVIKCVHGVEWQSENCPLPSSNWFEQPEAIVTIACEIKQLNNQGFVQVPFDTTLESECLGIQTKWTEGSIQGITVNPVTTQAPFNFDLFFSQLSAQISGEAWQSLPRFVGNLEAIRMLKVKGHPVIFNVTGPITLLSALMGFDNFLRVSRKSTEQLKCLFAVLDQFYMGYLQSFKEVGVDLISYADPLGNSEVLGPLYFEKWSLPIQLQQINLMRSKGISIHVCGNLSNAMLERGCFPYSEGHSSILNVNSSVQNTTGLNCVHTWK